MTKSKAINTAWHKYPDNPIPEDREYFLCCQKEGKRWISLEFVKAGTCPELTTHWKVIPYPEMPRREGD
jgi:hypothetical protein